ncbi:MAG TPA: hypothetical protein VMN37_08040 [Gemmatimonadales bacterium]|nr:hypothetical protein [Gemmatimonadales bacterium]
MTAPALGLARSLCLVAGLIPALPADAGGPGAALRQGMEGGLGSAASALGPAGAVAGSFAGGYALGDHLYHNTSVGDRSQDSLGWIDDLLTGEGESSWMVRQSEEFDEAWDDGDVLGVIGNGLQIGGAATAGAIGGLAGGVADAAGAAWDWMTDW